MEWLLGQSEGGGNQTEESGVWTGFLGEARKGFQQGRDMACILKSSLW